MNIRPSIKKLTDDVEIYAARKFIFRREIETLFEISEEQNLRQILNDVLFYAKFVTNASALLSRQGMKQGETDKLEIEFKSNLEKVMNLVKTIVKDAPEDMRLPISQKFFLLNSEGLTNFLKVLHELTWFKNYFIDHKEIY
ncbi:MAG: hypothetical protein ACHQQQ_00355 [Bacteroidota bacterium]